MPLPNTVRRLSARCRVSGQLVRHPPWASTVKHACHNPVTGGRRRRAHRPRTPATSDGQAAAAFPIRGQSAEPGWKGVHGHALTGAAPPLRNTHRSALRRRSQVSASRHTDLDGPKAGLCGRSDARASRGTRRAEGTLRPAHARSIRRYAKLHVARALAWRSFRLPFRSPASQLDRLGSCAGVRQSAAGPGTRARCLHRCRGRCATPAA